MSNNSGAMKTLLVAGGISLPVSTMLTNLVLDPNAAIEPTFYFILGLGFVFFTLSLVTFFSQKHEITQGIWHIASMSFAGGVLVSWAKYQAFSVSVIAAVVIIGSIALGAISRRKDLKNWYGRVVYAGLALAVVLPIVLVTQNIGQTPVVYVSPSPSYEYIYPPGNRTSTDIEVTLKSDYGNAYSVVLTAKPETNLLVAYLNGTAAPMEIGTLERLKVYSCMMRIDSLPDIAAHQGYNVSLTASYTDAFATKTYENSANFRVIIDPTPQFPASYILAPSPWLMGTIVASILEFIAYYVKYIVRARRP